MHTGKYCPFCAKGFGSREANVVNLATVLDPIKAKRLGEDIQARAHGHCWNGRKIDDTVVVDRIYRSANPEPKPVSPVKAVPARSSA
jgi:hypothetical protein